MPESNESAIVQPRCVRPARKYCASSRAFCEVAGPACAFAAVEDGADGFPTYSPTAIESVRWQAITAQSPGASVCSII